MVQQSALHSHVPELHTINPSSDLSNLGLTYNVEIDSTAIKDTAGNYFAGFSGTTYQINSKLVDTTAPYIISGPSVSSTIHIIHY